MTRTLLIALAALVVPASASAECLFETTPLDVEMFLDSAESSFVANDSTMFIAHVAMAEESLSCMVEPINTHLAARYHWVQALRLYQEQDQEGTRQAFFAVRELSPTVYASKALELSDHAIANAFPITDGQASWVAVPPTLQGSILFDGNPNTARPASWPTIMQVVDESGHPLVSAWLAPGDALPEYPSMQSVTLPEQYAAKNGRSRRRRGR